MGLTASSILSRINRKIHNAKAKIGGDAELYNILNEAARKTLLKVDFPSTKRISTPFVVYKDVYEYPMPTDISYDKMIEFKFEDEYGTVATEVEKTAPKYLFRSRNPYLLDSNSRNNWLLNTGNEKGVNDVDVVAVEFENGSPWLQVKTLSDKLATQISNCDTYNGNGTWVGTGDVSLVTSDSTRYREGSGSTSFDTGGSSTSVVLTNSTLTVVDLSDYEDKSSIFLHLSIPSTTPSSITLVWGSDSSNYWSKSITTKQNGLSFTAGWNLLGFDWRSATATGTPDADNIDYVQLTLTYSSAVAQVGFLLDDIECRIGREAVLNYYSKYTVSNVSGTRQETFSAGDDTTILGNKEVDILIDEATQIALEELREFKEAETRERQKNENTEFFKGEYPTESEPDSVTYYNL